MSNIADEYSFIFAVLIFYGFLFLLYSLNGNSLYGLTMTGITYTAPAPSGNWFLDIVLGTWNFFSTVIGFFNTLLITPFTAGNWAYFGFLNWAIFGSTIYILIRTIRGGG